MEGLMRATDIVLAGRLECPVILYDTERATLVGRSAARLNCRVKNSLRDGTVRSLGLT